MKNRTDDPRDPVIIAGGGVLIGLILILAARSLPLRALPTPPVVVRENPAPAQWNELPYYTRYQLAREAAVAAIWGHPQAMAPRNEAADDLERFALSGAGIHP